MSDLIRRSDAIKKIKWWFDLIKLNPDILIDSIITLPTIEPKRGEWVFDEKGYFFCSECKRKPNDQYATTDFCPNCGADMREVRDE